MVRVSIAAGSTPLSPTDRPLPAHSQAPLICVDVLIPWQARYAHLYDAPLREATERVGAFIESAGKESAEVIGLQKKRVEHPSLRKVGTHGPSRDSIISTGHRAD